MSTELSKSDDELGLILYAGGVAIILNPPQGEWKGEWKQKTDGAGV